MVVRGIIITPDHELGRSLTAALEATGQVEVARTLDHYPSAVELVRTLRALATEVVFIDFGSMKQGLEMVQIRRQTGASGKSSVSRTISTQRYFARQCELESANF